MYAVVEQGGQQFKVAEGDQLHIDLTDIEAEATELHLEKVLFISDGENIQVGTPYIEGAKVIATFADTAQNATVKGPKLYPAHFRRRKNSRKRIGHRQKYLGVTISKIEV